MTILSSSVKNHILEDLIMAGRYCICKMQEQWIRSKKKQEISIPNVLQKYLKRNRQHLSTTSDEINLFLEPFPPSKIIKHVEKSQHTNICVGNRRTIEESKTAKSNSYGNESIDKRA
ncbi:hypothetical protein AVEN_149684-1 [Araneus ventricosus]|uniref:Uncharacterized protein n=1 Tax=Araneus ventricosus TaxID=182803 RepID=A0A4Y2QHT3_ARAVE|nr:hypothetical protein AVEN_149684-1 [Araneus ventricosus]